MAVNQDVTSTSASPFSNVGNLYCKYFPSEKETFAARLSILSLIISLFALQILFFYVYWLREGIIFVHTFYVIIGSVHYGLYYGLSNNKLRLITPWLAWKFSEVIFTIILIFKGTLSSDRYAVANSILAFLIVVSDIMTIFWLHKNQVQASDVEDFQVESESKKATPEV